MKYFKLTFQLFCGYFVAKKICIGAMAVLEALYMLCAKPMYEYLRKEAMNGDTIAKHCCEVIGIPYKETQMKRKETIGFKAN